MDRPSVQGCEKVTRSILLASLLVNIIMIFTREKKLEDKAIECINLFTVESFILLMLNSIFLVHVSLFHIFSGRVNDV